jgi:hypothetical protein
MYGYTGGIGIPSMGDGDQGIGEYQGIGGDQGIGEYQGIVGDQGIGEWQLPPPPALGVIHEDVSPGWPLLVSLCANVGMGALVLYMFCTRPPPPGKPQRRCTQWENTNPVYRED